MRILTGIAVAVLCLALPSCASPPRHADGERPASRIVDERDNGTTVQIGLHGSITVMLHSTYWTFRPVPAGVLTQTGTPAVAAQPPGSECVPGQGCGTITAVYTATAIGSQTVGANRTSCGEARMCPANESWYSVDVVVVG
jgi:hypothetical protein